MIEKIKIINGLYYVSIPEVNLYIQCGSPVESVKHLAKAGLIKEINKEGVTFETGPNAILLSDIMIQNGEFSNMSEFSVLQMLYKQGSIIPNHPNNTGIKPILIGKSTQVNAQMQYIYRGNYGLVSKEEIEACGISSEYADELMRMKLRFAFGKLQSAKKLLDSCFVEESKVEIRNGVYIKRLGINLFEITYKDQSVQIDLNLKKYELYNSPYVLPQYKIYREYFSVIHSGQGDGWDCNRPSMNSIITFQGKLYLIDVVPNIKHILTALSIDINEIDGVFLTHTHDDHLAGITSLIRSDKQIKFYGTTLVISATAKKLSALLDIEEFEFYNFVDATPLLLGAWNDIDGLEVKPELSPHPVETTTFKFRTLYEDGYKTYGHFADIVSSKVLKDMIVEDKSSIGVSKEFYDEVISNYKETLDLKKVDIGGGMIHGESEDFIDDESSKIVLAHTSNELTLDQKRIGSGSLFGLSDVLIPSYHKYDLDIVLKYLVSNFPNISEYKRKMFLNFKSVDFNPETIIIKEGEDINNIYLLLSGQAELLDEQKGESIVLTPGTIIGEKTSSSYTYIAKNFVKALEIPLSFFNSFLEKNNLSQTIKDNAQSRSELLNTKLFNEEITYATMNRIIETLNFHNIKDGEIFNMDPNRIYLIMSGKVFVKIDNNALEVLQDGEHFGGVKSVLNYPSFFNFEVESGTVLYSVSSEALKNIPIVRWKILERYERQKGELYKHHSNNIEYELAWKQRYRINICEMDNQHKRLFEIIDNLNICLKLKSCSTAETILDTLIDYIKYHFSCEEEFMKEYKYINLEQHAKLHRSFEKKLQEYKQDIKNNRLNKTHMLLMLQSWLVNHILEDDKKYAKVLNEKGVF